MQGLLSILIALVVALLVWGGWQIALTLTAGQKRKLKQRLAGDSSLPGTARAPLPRSITLQREAAGLSGVLARLTIFEGLHRKLVQAYPDTTLVRFLAVAGWMAMGAFFLVALIFGSPVLGLIGGVIGGYIPFLMLSRRRGNRQRQLTQQLPEALDFLSRILRAGHSFSTGLQMMADELPQPMAGEFRRTYDQHSLGQSLEESLKDMAARVESTDFAFFVTAVLIQRQTGGDLSEVLNNISGMIRQRIRLQQSVKAKTAEGRFTGYTLVAFPAIMFCVSYVMNPQYAGILLHTSTGLTLLGVAVGLQLLGLYAIRKITTVRV